MVGPERSEYVVTIARHGRRTTTRSDVFLNYHQAYGQPDGPIDMDYFVWVIRNADRTVLVDTGYSRSGAESRGREVLLEASDLYSRLDVNPADAPLIVISHAHYDHIGNLGLFPRSRFLISRKEYDFWDASPHAHKPLFHHSVEDAEIDVLRQAVADGRVDFFEGAVEIAPGIRVLEVGGHTPGQSVVIVDTADGKVLLASDAVHYYEELEADMPFITLSDVIGMYDAFQTLRDLIASEGIAHVVSGHDPSTLGRFAPAGGRLSGIAATIGAVR